MSSNAIADNYLAYAARKLGQSQQIIARCCDKLTEEQMGHRRGDYENSVANLLMHLAGNLRQWILHGLDGQPDVRERDAEFSLDPTFTAAEARDRFDTTVAEAARVIAALDPERLLIVIDPQPTGTWRNPTILEAIFKVVSHVDHHAGQIILLTKQLTATDLDLSMPRKR
jgi:uncharacterized damage-inducible protein DinB